MLACLSSSSVTVRSNEMWPKKFRMKTEMGLSPPCSLDVGIWLMPCPGHYVGLFLQSWYLSSCWLWLWLLFSILLLWQMLEAYIVPLEAFNQCLAYQLIFLSPGRKARDEISFPDSFCWIRTMSETPMMLYFFLFLLLVCSLSIINGFSLELLLNLPAYNFFFERWRELIWDN